jgi:putative transposase
VYRWVRQDGIDRGEIAGTSTVDNAELRAAKRRIAELESELAVVKRASALFDEGRVVRPKAVFASWSPWPVRVMAPSGSAAFLRVAPSGFFRWRAMPPSDRSIRRAWLADVIVEIHDQSRRTYGCRRIRAELADAYGQRVNKKLIRTIMAEQAISGLPRRRKGKPNLVHRATSADLVNRVFHRDGPNQL